MGSLLRRWHRFRRRVLVHRRLLAAVLAGSAVLFGLEAASGEPAPTEQVWVTARDLPTGAVIGPDDLRREAFVPGTAPGAVDADEATGRVVAAPLVAGEPVTSAHLVGPGLAHGRAGEVAVPVRITDPGVVDLLHAGDQVDLVAVDPGGTGRAATIATAVTVLAVPERSDATVTGSTPGRLVVVSSPRDESDILVAASVTRFLTVRWSG
jgi:Flp pilus assembly protein CpaB